MDDLMSKVEHKQPNKGGGFGLGELLILAGILLLGLAVMLSLGAGDSGPSERAEVPASQPADVTSVATPVVVAPSSVPSPVATVTPSATSPAPAPVAALSQPVLTPKPTLPAATHIAIPSVGIDAKVVDVGYQIVTIEGQAVRQLQVADYAAGHDALSANPGAGGNIVISGHDDWKGEVFKNLHNVKPGDQVLLATPQATYRYVITEVIYRKDVGVSLADRLAAGQYLAPMPDERVTLVTCWPYGVDTHRLIVVAKPA